MGIFETFVRGLSTTNKRIRMVIYLWLMNFIFSVMVITPIYFLLQKDFSRSLMGDQIGRGFDLLWLADLVYKHKNLLPALIGWFLIPGIFFLLLYIFLNGGIIGRIAAQEEKVNLSNFFADCGKYFFRFFRVFLISLLGYFVIFGIVFKGISALFKLWTKNASTEWPLIISSNIKFLIMLLLFTIVRMFFDYVRVSLVVEESKKTIRAAFLNFSFLGKKFFKAWFLYLLVGLVAIILGVVFLTIWQPLPKMGFLLIVVFIWQQIYILSKMWTKVLFFSTEYHFFAFHKTFLY